MTDLPAEKPAPNVNEYGTRELENHFRSGKRLTRAEELQVLSSLEEKRVNYELMPQVKKLVYGQGLVSLNRAVELVLDPGVDLYTANRLKAVLQEAGLDYDVVEEATGGFAVRTRIVKDLVGIDAYRLTVGQDGIEVVGRDSDAVFYGLTTLGQILRQEGVPALRELTIEDHADIKNRGFIEGYYGNPWSHKDRMELMSFGGALKLTQYFFAPKDDPYHNAKWRELYPEEKLAEIRELARVGNENKVRYTYTLHPFMYKPIRFGAAYQDDLQVIKNKFSQLLQAGVREFGILADDARLPQDGAASYVRLMTDLTNWLREQQGTYKDLRTDMIFVPHEYWGKGNEPELRHLNEYLPSGVSMTVTGGRIAGEVASSFLNTFKDRISQGGKTFQPVQFWINWPAVDNSKQHLILGGGHQFLHPQVDPSLIKGIMINPMPHAEASKVALFDLASYTWKVWQSKEEALTLHEKAFPFIESGRFTDTPASQALSRLAKHMINQNRDNRVVSLDESVDLAPSLTSFLQDLKAGRNIQAAAQSLLQEFQQLQDAARVYAEQGHADMREQIQPWLAHTVDFMDALKLALKAAQDYQAGLETSDTVAAAQNRYQASKEHHFWYVDHEEFAEMGVQHLRPFLLEVLTFLQIKNLEKAHPDQEQHLFIANRKNFQGDPSLLEDGKVDQALTFKKPNFSLRGDYIGYLFNKTLDVHSLYLAMGSPHNLKDTFNRSILQYLDENYEWQNLDSTIHTAKDALISRQNLTLKAKGIRLLALDKKDNSWLAIREFLINQEGDRMIGG